MTFAPSLHPQSSSSADLRALRRETKHYDVVVAGGGLAGIGAAITAARHGARVALIQDRPVLGGNASKEIRVWPQGASGGLYAVWFRETGLMEELLLENQFRNPFGNAELWDTVLLDAVLGQKNLELHLNTSVLEVQMDPAAPVRIRSITALTLHSERITTFEAGYFVDCTGDGTVGFLAGAPYMTGREAKSEFGESLAPNEHRAYTLGGSILFLAKDAGHPIAFHPPAFAHKFTEKDFRKGRNPIHEFDRIRGGFWWVEWGGTLNTIDDNEAIKYELLKIAYGIFDWLKNDPSQKEKNKNLTLEWVGTIPGKRESRRFIGDHILTEQDVVERRDFSDAVAFGGWNLDDHAPKGFFDEEHSPSTHTQIPGLYNIPLRSLYSKTISNLFFAGRNISATHIALTSVRVMLTCAQMGEAAGAAATVCLQKNVSPRELASGKNFSELCHKLLRDDHSIVGACSKDPADLLQTNGVNVEASSQRTAVSLDHSDRLFPLDKDRLILFPVCSGPLSFVDVLLTVRTDSMLGWQLHHADGRGGTIPAGVLAEGCLPVLTGVTQWVQIPLATNVDRDDWYMLELKRNPDVSWHGNNQRLVGLKSYMASAEGFFGHSSPNRHSRFKCLKASGNESEQNYCVRLPQDSRIYAPYNAINGYSRPFKMPNIWISKETDFSQPEWLQITWNKTVPIQEIMFLFDSDLDRHLTATWISAPYNVEPDLVKDYDIELSCAGKWGKIAEIRDNHSRRRVHTLGKAMLADALRLTILATNGTPRAQVYAAHVYA